MKKEKSGLRLLSHVLILSLCVIIAVIATFSWYNRTTITNIGTTNKLTYTQSGKITGTGCTAKTYVGNEVNGTITYSDEEASTAQINAQPGDVKYFRTMITDGSDMNSSISVYLEGFTYTSAMSGKVKIGLTYPEKTYKNYSSTMVCLEDNITIDAGDTIYIDWFIEILGSYSGTIGDINLGSIHVVYN